MQALLLKGLRTTDVQIRNRTTLDDNDELRLTIKRKVTNRSEESSSTYLCKLKVVVTKKNMPEEDNSFLISVEVIALLEYEIPNTPFENIQEPALQEIYPHLRAIIASVTAAAGMHDILIPLQI